MEELLEAYLMQVRHLGFWVMISRVSTSRVWGYKFRVLEGVEELLEAYFMQMVTCRVLGLDQFVF